MDVLYVLTENVNFYIFTFCSIPASTCTFEKDKCNWYDASDDSDHFDWVRKQGRTSSFGTGPSVDHTLGTNKGYYVYIETSTGALGQRARFLSPWFKKVLVCLNLTFILRFSSTQKPFKFRKTLSRLMKSS